jgi:hypothetical protein
MNPYFFLLIYSYVFFRIIRSGPAGNVIKLKGLNLKIEHWVLTIEYFLINA